MPGAPTRHATLFVLAIAAALLLSCSPAKEGVSPSSDARADTRFDTGSGPDFEIEAEVEIAVETGREDKGGGPVPECEVAQDCPAVGLCHQVSCTDGQCEIRWAESACDDDNACTTDDSCIMGHCSGKPLDCQDDNPCTTESCDPVEGCVHHPAEGLPCSDGDPCTSQDTCSSGGCSGLPVECDDANPCTVDGCTPDTGQCSHLSQAGIPCDDGDVCTTDDACQEGLCLGGGALVCVDGNICTDDYCSPEEGCLFIANEAPCSDGNPCTFEDRCKLQTCYPGETPDCFDGNPCTADGCDIASGLCTHLAADWPCDDGSLCTTADMCTAGLCTGEAVDCDDGNVCTADGCHPATGCSHVPVSSPCDDGNPCTTGDLCQGGACIPGPNQLSCDDGNDCTADSCLPASGECLHAPSAGPCDDENPCSSGDHCEGGLCVAGDYGICQCQSDAECAPFEDGNKCNGEFFCDTASWPPKCKMLPGSVVTCSTQFDTNCAKTSCLPGIGICVLQDLPDFTDCEDGNPCTIGDFCDDGLCTSAGVIDCDDANPCTVDSCDSDKGCIYEANTVPCDDGNLCTTGDLCQGGNCLGVPVICEDGNPCSAGACQPDSGGCSFTLTLGSCNDSNPCTENDHCEEGLCVGEPRSCEDSLSCTADSCEPAQGCVHEPIVGECDDGNECTALDHCIGTNCKGTPMWCGDDDVCTDDFCFADQGCVHPFNVAPCNDGNICTYGDTCSNGECVGLVVGCDDGNPCTSSYCHPQAGCVFTYLDMPCNDFNGCTLGDWCIAGVCIPGTPTICDDGNVCTLDKCDPATGICLYPGMGGPCDDENFCTTSDMCVDGGCAGFPVDCNDLNPCTSDSCQVDVGCVHAVMDGGFCDDGDPCTTGDYCDAGECVGSGWVECNDGQSCTLDFCSAGIGCTFVPLTGPACDDGNPATLEDVCLDGSCTGLADGDLDGVPEDGYNSPCSGAPGGCVDNCPGDANPGQEDADLDLIGDVCDDCGELQPIDGITPPLPGLWEWTATGSCPEDNHSFGARTTAVGEFAMELVGVRDAECDTGTASLYLSPTQDYFGKSTVVSFELEWEASVLPFEFLGTSLARITVSDGETELAIFTQASLKGETECGKPAVIPESEQRSLWSLEFSQSGGLKVHRDGEEIDDSPFNLLELEEQWRIGIHTLSGDLAGNCGTTGRITIYSYEHVCTP